MRRTPIRVPWRTRRRLARAREHWRDAAFVVASRWDAFLIADAGSRAAAFAAYVAALDAEEAAAAAIARLCPDLPRAAEASSSAVSALG
jgi:hypothetical protein